MSHDPDDPGVRDDEAAASWAGLGAAWREGAPTALEPIDSAEIARRAERFAQRIRFRNAREWVAGALICGYGVYRLAHAASPSDGVISTLLIAFAVWTSAVIFLRGRTGVAPSPGAATEIFLAYERAELERQRALLASYRRWSIAPLAGVVAVTFALTVFELHARGGGLGQPRVVAILGAVLAFMVGVLVGIDRLNVVGARDLAKRIAKLAALP